MILIGVASILLISTYCPEEVREPIIMFLAVACLALGLMEEKERKQ